MECDDFYCLDLKKGICFDNAFGPDDEDQKIYYACNVTNDEGTECELCINDYYELENGICVNKGDCAKEKNGECIKCNERNYEGYFACLNKVYGCVDTLSQNCLKCDEIFDFSKCTECNEGYALDIYGKCVEV